VPVGAPAGCGAGCQYAHQVLDYSSEYLYNQATPTNLGLTGAPDVYPTVGRGLHASTFQLT
jgi:hypothetical protein